MAALRQPRPPAPLRRRQPSSEIEQYADLRGLTDLRRRHLPESLLAAVAPLSLVCPEENIAKYRAQLLKDLRVRCAGISAFLPDQYQYLSTPEQYIIPSQRQGQVVVRRPSSSRPGPLEIIVPENYQQPQGYSSLLQYGVGHYVYDPLSASWFLVRRWGQNGAYAVGPIKPFKQWREASRLAVEKHRQLQQLPLVPPAEDFFTAANQGLLARARKSLGI